MDDDEAALQEQVKTTLYGMTVPVTSRPRHEGEVAGQDYHFVTPQEFEEVRVYVRVCVCVRVHVRVHVRVCVRVHLMLILLWA